MLASPPVILLAFNSHFCDAILTLEKLKTEKPAIQTPKTASKASLTSQPCNDYEYHSNRRHLHRPRNHD